MKMSEAETLDWASLGQTRVGEVEAPKGLPDGHYSAIITGNGKVDNVGKNKTLVITFPIRLNEPMTDVDEEAFAASDGLSGRSDELSFYLTPKSLYRFTEFGKAMGATDDMSIPEMAEYLATCGNEFVVTGSTQTSARGRQYFNIDDPIPLSAFQG
jgi:hypothetical protein